MDVRVRGEGDAPLKEDAMARLRFMRRIGNERRKQPPSCQSSILDLGLEASRLVGRSVALIFFRVTQKIRGTSSSLFLCGLAGRPIHVLCSGSSSAPFVLMHVFARPRPLQRTGHCTDREQPSCHAPLSCVLLASCYFLSSPYIRCKSLAKAHELASPTLA